MVRTKELKQEISLLHSELGYWALRMQEAIRKPRGGRRRLGSTAFFVDRLPEELEDFALDAEVIA